MTKQTRRTNGAGFEAKVVMAAVKGENALAERANVFDVRPIQFLAGRCSCRRFFPKYFALA